MTRFICSLCNEDLPPLRSMQSQSIFFHFNSIEIYAFLSKQELRGEGELELEMSPSFPREKLCVAWLKIILTSSNDA